METRSSSPRGVGFRGSARWVWWQLTRPRGHVRHRYYRVGRTSRAGVALLMVLSSIMLLTLLVTEIAHGAAVRLQLAAHHRDEVAAEALAHTGVNIYRLVLMASKQLGKNPMIMQASEFLGINGDSLWQMVPYFNTQLLRMIFVSGGDLEAEDVAQGLTEEERAASREGSTALRRNFLDFDGDFTASIEDVSRFVYVGDLKAQTFADLLDLDATKQMQGLMAREEVRDYFYQENIDPLELIGNLVDWTDVDDTRIYKGGDEAAPYQRLDPPRKPKNAPFDTPSEIRLVDGWHLDGVWRRLGQHLTIFGNGKVNINSADGPVLRALLATYMDGVYSEQYLDQTVEELLRLRALPRAEGGLHFGSGQGFKTAVETQIQASIPLKDEILQAIGTESMVFRVESTAEVGGARVAIRAVLDYTTDPTGAVLYWKTE